MGMIAKPFHGLLSHLRIHARVVTQRSDTFDDLEHQEEPAGQSHSSCSADVRNKQHVVHNQHTYRFMSHGKTDYSVGCWAMTAVLCH